MLLFPSLSCCPKAVSQRIAEIRWTPPNAPQDFCSCKCFALFWHKQDSSLWACASWRNPTCFSALRHPTVRSESFAELSSETPWHISGPRARCQTIWGWICLKGASTSNESCYAPARPWNAPWTCLCSVSSQLDSAARGHWYDVIWYDMPLLCLIKSSRWFDAASFNIDITHHYKDCPK